MAMVQVTVHDHMTSFQIWNYWYGYIATSPALLYTPYSLRTQEEVSGQHSLFGPSHQP